MRGVRCILFSLLACTTATTVRKIVGNKNITLNVLNFKAFANTGYQTGTEFLNNGTLSTSLTPKKCGILCSKTKNCCAFFFKENVFCKLVDTYFSMNKTITQNGVIYYENKVMFKLMFINVL